MTTKTDLRERGKPDSQQSWLADTALGVRPQVNNASTEPLTPPLLKNKAKAKKSRHRRNRQVAAIPSFSLKWSATRLSVEQIMQRDLISRRRTRCDC